MDGNVDLVPRMVPTWFQMHPTFILRRVQNYHQIILTLLKTYSEIVQKLSQNYPQIVPNYAKSSFYTPRLPHICLECTPWMHPLTSGSKSWLLKKLAPRNNEHRKKSARNSLKQNGFWCTFVFFPNSISQDLIIFPGTKKVHKLKNKNKSINGPMIFQIWS